MKPYRFPKTTLALFGLILTARCGSDSPSGVGGGDTTAPGVVSVTPVDMQHVRVLFTEAVERQSATAPGHYTITERAPVRSKTSAPGDELPVSSAVLGADGKSVDLTTGSPMQQVPYDIAVTGVRDLAGNAITSSVVSSFTGNTDPDVTAPTIVDRTPAPGATSVALGQSVWVQFSESMDYSSVLAAFHWAPAAGPGTVAWTANSDDSALFVFTSTEALDPGTTYSVSVGTGAADWAGNHLATTTWTFQTTLQVDNTPPSLVSSVPANGATHVALTTSISMTFSEPISPLLEEILVSPDPGEGSLQWSSDGRTFTFDPNADLLPDTQYSLLAPPGAVKDLAGNGTADPIAIVFTTGNAIASGSFSGTLAGDPASIAASNPAGALVVAADLSPFSPENFGIAGHGVAGDGGSYEVGHLPDGTYWPFAVLETNGDGLLNPETGDAIGVYGIDFSSFTGAADSVTVAGGGVVTGVDFMLFDPVALAGRVEYSGTYTGCCYDYYVGVFDTTGFNPNDPPSLSPVYGTQGNLPYQPTWWVNQIDNELQPGTYYVGAFLDIDGNSSLDASEPLGIYASAGGPIPLTIANGADILDIVVVMEDPVPGAVPWAPVEWKTAGASEVTPRVEVFRRAMAVIRRAVQEQHLALSRR